MDPAHSLIDDTKSVEKLNKRYGPLKALLCQFQSKIFYLLPFLVLIALQWRNESRFNTLENLINIKNTINIGLNGAESSIKPTPVVNYGKTQDPETLGLSTEFNPDEWIIVGFNPSPDREGFYCPETKKFNYWSMWSKSKIPLKFSSVKIRAKVKMIDKKSLPTIVISYGDYIPNFSPYVYYRLNIFDEDLKSIRLYDENDKSVAQDRFSDTPNLESEVVITLSPRVPNPSIRKLNINPTLKYVSSESNRDIPFIPVSDFSTYLPSVDIEDSVLKKQIGIGTSMGSCIKPISVDLVP
jgi:hypothetical protein